jgi:hypothetical protein
MARTVSFAGLFRRAQNSLERRVSSAKDPVVLQQSPIFVRSITWVLMGGVTFGVLWLAFAQTDEVVIAPGKLEPIGDVKIVQPGIHFNGDQTPIITQAGRACSFSGW